MYIAVKLVCLSRGGLPLPHPSLPPPFECSLYYVCTCKWVEKEPSLIFVTATTSRRVNEERKTTIVVLCCGLQSAEGKETHDKSC